MSAGSTLARTAAAFIVSACWGSALAQTCAAPLDLMANTTHTVDTCQGDSTVVMACGVLPLTGPASVMSLNLPYPAGMISIHAPGGAFTPVALLFHADCDGSAPCNAGIDTWPSGIGEIDLGVLDSGQYLLVISSIDPPPAITCGIVTVTTYSTPEQDALVSEGVFRGGTTPLWEP